uniref:DRBM domain-containing protein n=1 Tax=Leersia perrieri TaxID=77586 RepID=A0A0D9XCM1_9ORYZ
MEDKSNTPFQSFAGLSEKFTSSRHHREAEQNDNLTRREYTSAEFTDALCWIDQGVFSCKVILHDFTMRASITEPSYITSRSDGICSYFVSSVLAGGWKYTGDRASTEEEAKENAARVAVRSLLATKNNYMLESIRSNKPTGATIQGEQSSQTAAHPVVTFTPTITNYISCAPHYVMQVPHEQMEWHHPGTGHTPILSREQLRHPAAHMPFLPHEQMQWSRAAKQMPQMQWRDPAAHRPFLRPEQILQLNAAVGHTPSEMMQMCQLPQSISSTSSELQNGLYSDNTAQDDDMIVEVGSYEEATTLSGTKRKVDESEEPESKQARTSQAASIVTIILRTIHSHHMVCRS